MTQANGFREYARVDIAAEILASVLPLVPSTMQLMGSMDGAAPGVVRLMFDVTDTGLPGGEWTGTMTHKGATLIAEWRGQGPVTPRDGAEPLTATTPPPQTWEAFARGKCRRCDEFKRVDRANVCVTCATDGAVGELEAQANG